MHTAVINRSTKPAKVTLIVSDLLRFRFDLGFSKDQSRRSVSLFVDGAKGQQSAPRHSFRLPSYLQYG